MEDLSEEILLQCKNYLHSLSLIYEICLTEATLHSLNSQKSEHKEYLINLVSQAIRDLKIKACIKMGALSYDHYAFAKFLEEKKVMFQNFKDFIADKYKEELCKELLENYKHIDQLEYFIKWNLWLEKSLMI